MFKLPLSVSGIGARVALNILGSLEPEALFRPLPVEMKKTLVTIPGIGKKTVTAPDFRVER